MIDPTTERRALDALLARFPFFDLLRVEWQLGQELGWDPPGPWVLVDLGQRSDDRAEAWAVHHFAIWKRTGAVHGVDAEGAVIDPPLIPGTFGVNTRGETLEAALAAQAYKEGLRRGEQLKAGQSPAGGVAPIYLDYDEAKVLALAVDLLGRLSQHMTSDDAAQLATAVIEWKDGEGGVARLDQTLAAARDRLPILSSLQTALAELSIQLERERSVEP